MWFKQLCVFQLDADWTLPPAALETLLAQRPLVPCPASAPEITGWVPPADDGVLVRSLGKHLLIALGWETRLLPSGVVNDAAADKAAAFEQQRGFKPGRKLMKEIKEQVAAELLPRAFTRRTALRAWIDPEAKRIVVDTGTASKAEVLIEHLRDALGTLPVVPWSVDNSPAVTMTGWLTAGQAPGSFFIDDACELSGSDDTRSVVRYVRHELLPAQLNRHIDEGLRATQLALTWDGQLAFTLTEPLIIKKVKFLEADNEDADRVDNAQLAFEADFALMTGTLGKVLDQLHEVLGSQ